MYLCIYLLHIHELLYITHSFLDGHLEKVVKFWFTHMSLSTQYVPLIIRILSTTLPPAPSGVRKKKFFSFNNKFYLELAIKDHELLTILCKRSQVRDIRHTSWSERQGSVTICCNISVGRPSKEGASISTHEFDHTHELLIMYKTIKKLINYPHHVELWLSDFCWYGSICTIKLLLYAYVLL